MLWEGFRGWCLLQKWVIIWQGDQEPKGDTVKELRSNIIIDLRESIIIELRGSIIIELGENIIRELRGSIITLQENNG